MKFEIELNWEIADDQEARLVVSGVYDSSPGNRRGHPDTWTPPWTEMEVAHVKNAETGEAYAPEVVGALCAGDSFLRAVEEKIISQHA